MPNVTAPTRQMGNGDVVTQFVDSVGTSAVTYTYPKTQEKFIVRNMGPSSLSVTIAGVTQVIQRGDKWQKIADFTSFTINAVSGFTAFDAWADEKGSTFDSAEGQYFAGGVVSGGGSGIAFEALANGETVTIDNSAPPAIPAVPTGLAANPQSTQVSLTWNAASGATSYKVYRGGVLIASPTSASYTDTGLTNGTSYSYTVSAVNSGGESSQSSAVTATPVAPSLPATPAAPTATAGNTQVALTWGTVSGATGYKVYRGGTLIASPSVTNYTDTGLTNGTAYSYTVSATNAAGESAQSSSASATPIVPVTGVTDDFNRGVDSATSLGTATTGQVWTALVGTWGISSNQAYCASTTSEAVAVVESGLSDVTVQVKLATNRPTNVRLAFRVVDATNMLIVNTDTGGVYKLYKRIAGTYTALGTSTGVTSANGDIVKVVLVGSSVTVFVNNVQVITATCTDHQTATKHGLGNTSETTARYDDFSIA